MRVLDIDWIINMDVEVILKDNKLCEGENGS